jgi:DNA-3-methyladenine glycosylase II
MARLTQQQIKDYLVQRDRRLRPVIHAVPYPRARRNRDVYRSLVRSIISQQLSVKAAKTIHTRLLELFPDGEAHPELLVRMSRNRLRSAGLSEQKVNFLKGIARVAREGGLDYADLSRRNDDELIDTLTRLHGVGRWTVEMLLMFTFDRPNVFPVADVGIQNAMRTLYGMKEEGKAFRQRMVTIANRWQPYRTVACRYLWAWRSPDTGAR